MSFELRFAIAMTDSLTRPANEIKSHNSKNTIIIFKYIFVFSAGRHAARSSDRYTAIFSQSPTSLPTHTWHRAGFSLTSPACITESLSSLPPVPQPARGLLRELHFFQEGFPLTSRTLRDLISNQSHADLYFLPVPRVHLISHK